MSNNNAGHLYGESVIKGDYFAVETTNGNKPMEYTTTNGLKLKELAEPVSDTDAATKKYVDDNAGGGGGGLFELIGLESFDPDDTEQVTTLGEAVVAVIEDNKIPVITVDGSYFNLNAIFSGDSGREYQFVCWTIELDTPPAGVLMGILLTYDLDNNEWAAENPVIPITGQE